VSRILRYDDIDRRLDKPAGMPAVVTDSLPRDTHHGWKFIAFGPDGKLYVPVGAPCNICDPGDPYASILRMNADGSGREVFARGVRNSVGFDWSPVDGALWFTDNGRDMLGDDSPPDELNHAARRPAFRLSLLPRRRDRRSGIRRAAQVRRIRAAGAKTRAACRRLGMRFYTGTMFPPNTATRSSSPSTARGTARRRSATGSPWYA
jgi:glucose/arabinose dehydrogenase